MKILNLVHSTRGDIGFTKIRFPDGQSHIELMNPGSIGEWEHVQIITRLHTADDILDLGMVVDAVRSVVRGRISVNISYMLGARMDRAIGPGKPFTLRILAGMVNAACQEANDVRILDPHSPVTLQLVHRSTAVAPIRLVHGAVACADVVVIPDAGAVARTLPLLPPEERTLAYCEKTRDPATGKLSGFRLVRGDVKDKTCLIVDDLCDGGGTFAGVAAVLRAAGARTVKLCVTHGIFSRGTTIDGIDHVFTTDSYMDVEPGSKVTVVTNYMLQWVRGAK